MNPEEEANKEILWVLRVIKKTIKIEGYGLVCVIKVDFPDLMLKYPGSSSLVNIRNIVRNQLEKKHKVLEIIETYNKPWNESTKFILEINEQKFEKLYQRLEAAVINKSKTLKPLAPPSYNKTSHKIIFKGQEIVMPSDSNQDSLCRVIFKDKDSLRKEWNWDEMLEEWGGSYDGKEAWRKVYNAAREINKKVAIETGVKDLLIVKKLTTALDPNYLK